MCLNLIGRSVRPRRPSIDAWLRGGKPAGRWGEPEELVGAAIFLASAASGYVNGHILYVDGGMLAVV